MIFSKRDRNSMLLIVLILVFGLSYLIGAPMVRSLQEAKSARTRLERDISFAKRAVQKRDVLDLRLNNLISELPSYSMTERVTAQLLKRIEQLASKNGVILKRNEAGQEEVIGDLYEVAVDGAWEAELDPLVRMLYDVQIQGATLDMRQLSVSPSSGSKMLKGTFKIYFAFTRSSAGEQDDEGRGG